MRQVSGWIMRKNARSGYVMICPEDYEDAGLLILDAYKDEKVMLAPRQML